jgi:hypothetical protein
MPVLLEIADDDLRTALTLWLEDAGYPAIPADRARTMRHILARSAEPLVAILDLPPGEPAAVEHLLRLATTGGVWGRHHYVILATLPPERWPTPLEQLAERAHASVLQMPADLEQIVPTIAQVQIAQPTGRASRPA